MTPGQTVRRLLGPAFPVVGEAYRRIFVDMPKVVAWMDPHIPKGSHILDVGGGDGYVVDLLLTRRPDIQVTMTDLAPTIGSFISEANMARVELRPATDVAAVNRAFNVLTMADVVHHVPQEARPGFLQAIGDTALRCGVTTILVKDIEPGNVRAALSLWSDLYITGDRGVSLAPSKEIAIPGFRCTDRAMPDFPNYCLRFERSV